MSSPVTFIKVGLADISQVPETGRGFSLSVLLYSASVVLVLYSTRVLDSDSGRLYFTSTALLHSVLWYSGG
jgi:hypothetical protein